MRVVSAFYVLISQYESKEIRTTDVSPLFLSPATSDLNV
jgi:hypothetical protein